MAASTMLWRRGLFLRYRLGMPTARYLAVLNGDRLGDDVPGRPSVERAAGAACLTGKLWH